MAKLLLIYLGTHLRVGGYDEAVAACNAAMFNDETAEKARQVVRGFAEKAGILVPGNH